MHREISEPIRGNILRWVPGSIPLTLHAPGKGAEDHAPGTQPFSRMGGAERSAVEPNPGPSGHDAKRSIDTLTSIGDRRIRHRLRSLTPPLRQPGPPRRAAPRVT